MAKIKHTPPPWKGCNDDVTCKCGMIWKDPPGLHLATVHHGEPDFTLSEEEYSANWRLMIAAPDLYAALRRIVDGEMMRPMCDDDYEALEQAESALDKATGHVA